MEFNKLINERFSVRRFKDHPLEKGIIEEILKAGHLAPTGCNLQPQRILVINTNESLTKLKKCTKCHFDAPCAMLICYNRDETWTRPYDGEISAPVDSSIVATHMMLAAQNVGIGTCWVMHFNPIAMRREFNIPDNIIPQTLLVMGYPHEDAQPLPMHFTYRPSEEIVFFNSF